MKLTITSRLTATTAFLTLILFVPAGIGLFFSVASVIRKEGIRRADANARTLAFNAFYELDNMLMVRYKPGADPLRLDALQATDWALVRGNGRVVDIRGELFAGEKAHTTPGASHLVEQPTTTYRVASVPLLPTPPETFSALPAAVREVVREKSPNGVFLRSERSAEKGTPIVEIDLLEPKYIVELEISYPDGKFIEGDTKEYPKTMPPDLRATIAEESGVEVVAFQSWKAYRGQLIAVVTGRDPSGAGKVLAVNRLGERFLQDEDGAILGPAPDSRLWLVAGIDAFAERSELQRLFVTLALGLPALWIAVVLVGWYITRRAMSPVGRIVDAAERIGVSRLDQRLPVGPVEDELHRISSTINGMLDRIEEGYKREREFTGDASHELRGPLAKVIADIDVALTKEREASEYRETLERCRNYANSIERLVDSLLWLSRLDSTGEARETQSFELTDLAAETVRFFPTEDAARVQLEVDGAGIVAEGTPGLVRVMLQNLLQNALRYSPTESTVVVRITSANGIAKVEVEDRGEGIPPDELSQVFSRFYRVDKSRARETGGFGLGLSIVSAIARAHNTEVTLENRSGGGLRASFELPAGNAPQEVSQRPAPVTP